MIQHAIDLSHYHFQKRRGELALYGTWYADKARPCLVVVPANRIGHERCRPLVVTIDDAWQWNPDDPDAMPETNAAMVQQFLDLNGIPTQMRHRRSIRHFFITGSGVPFAPSGAAL